MRMEKRLAEFLVHASFTLTCATRIGVVSKTKQIEVADVLAQHGVQLPVVVQPDWYFLGQ
jgi:hypothetical protein